MHGGFATRSLNSNLANFQHGVDALYNQIVSLGVTPSGKTLDAVKNSISTVSNNSYNTGYAKGSSDGYNSGYNAGKSSASISRITSVYRSGTNGSADAWTCSFGGYLTGAKYALIEYQVQWPDRVTGLSFGGCTVISQIGADDLGVNGDNTVYVRTILIKDISSSAYFTEQRSGNATYRGCNVIGIYA